MGDRCYMQVTCRRKDSEEFEDIDFTMQDWNNENPDSPTVVMVDEEANHGHCDEMPTNIPYHGYNGHGDNYGDSAFACDGKRYAEAPTGYDGGFVVQWDQVKGRPTPQSLRAIRRYVAIRKKVEQMFKKLSTKPTHNQRKEPSHGTDHSLLVQGERP